MADLEERLFKIGWERISRKLEGLFDIPDRFIRKMFHEIREDLKRMAEKIDELSTAVDGLETDIQALDASVAKNLTEQTAELKRLTELLDDNGVPAKEVERLVNEAIAATTAKEKKAVEEKLEPILQKLRNTAAINKKVAAASKAMDDAIADLPPEEEEEESTDENGEVVRASKRKRPVNPQDPTAKVTPNTPIIDPVTGERRPIVKGLSDSDVPYNNTAFEVDPATGKSRANAVKPETPNKPPVLGQPTQTDTASLHPGKPKH